MAWYKTGSIKATQNSNVVIGTGTDWKNNLYGLGEGQALVFGNNRVEIMYVVSNTEIRLAEPYKGANYTGAYHIENSFAGGSGDYVRQISAAIRRFAEWGLDLNEWMTSTADYIDVKDANGNIIKIPTMKNYIKLGDFGIGALNNLKDKNLDDVRVAGDYQQDSNALATIDKNYPIGEAGALRVSQTVGGFGSGGCIHEYTTYLTARKFIRVRASAKWYPWEELPNRHSNDTQFFKGQVNSYSGLYCFDVNNPNNYFGMKRAIKDDPYGFFLSYNGSGHTIRFPYKMGGDIVLTNTGSSPNVADNRFLLFRAEKEGQAAYIEYQKPDGSQRWRVGSMGNNTNVALTTGGGGILVLDADGCSVNGRKSLCEGDFGIGKVSNYVNDLYLTDLANGVGGFFAQGASSGSNYFGTYGCGINIRYDASGAGRLFIKGSGNATTEYRSGSVVRRNDLWGTLNTTIDSAGFIKKASPIVKVYGDGSFDLNDESEGVIVKKLGIGHYLVLNTEGFHSDHGWGIDGGLSVPKDHNDNPLIWIEPEINADGSIDIYTFHRENYIPDNIRKMREKRLAKMGGVYTSKVDGEPCDIPNGTFIDVRVEMPYNSIYNVKMRALENVFALEAIISKQQEILSNTTLQLQSL
ncbi:hypothetical protein [Vibrio phage vB_VibM_83AMN]|nr:hypothetical protein [Vibrio phage vB_VibM_83AMN]